MNTNKSIGGAALILSWALLLSARCIGASIYGAQPGSSYETGLQRIGNGMPNCAWGCFIAGIALIICSVISEIRARQSQ